MTTRWPVPRTRTILVAATALLAAACGGGGGDEAASTAASAPTSTAAAPSSTAAAPTTTTVSARNDVPDAVVRDVDTGEEVNLESLVPSEKPILFWFWAPH